MPKLGSGRANTSEVEKIFFVVEFIIERGRPPRVFTAFLIVAAL
jgi:hypothetical protein